MILSKIRDQGRRGDRSTGHEDEARRSECWWQRDRLPDAVRALVLEDQRRRNEICWDVFDA